MFPIKKNISALHQDVYTFVQYVTNETYEKIS